MKTSTTTTIHQNRVTRAVQTAILRLVAVAMLASVFAVGALAPTADAQQERRTERGSQIQVQPGQPLDELAATGSEMSEIDRQMAAAASSPELVAIVQSTDLGRPGAAGIDARLQAETAALVQHTALPTQPEFADMFNGQLRRHFVSTPTYSEPVVVTADEVLVDRTISYELAPGACIKPADRQALGEMCFDIDRTQPMSDEVRSEVAAMRQKLAGVPAGQVVASGVTAGQARAMSDVDLVDLALNGGPRTIRRLSTIPRDPSGGLAQIDPIQQGGGVAAGAVDVAGVAVDQNAVADHYNFGTEYFLTGFTYYLDFGDVWEFEHDTFFTPRIYFGIAYSVHAGIGVRAPFSVDVDYLGGGDDQVEMGVSVDPVSLDVAAPHVGLADGAYFDGNEFVFELDVNCSVMADLPLFGKRSLTCDDFYSIDFNMSRDFDPVIGDEVRTIHNWWLYEDGESPFRMELFGGAAYGEINVGVGADIEDGKVGARIEGAGAAHVAGVSQSDVTWFADRAVRPIDVTHTDASGRLGGGIQISDPHYAFNVALRPKVKLTAGVDVLGFEKQWSMVFPLSFVSISVGVTLDHHNGTVESHNYDLFDGYLTQHVDTAGEVIVVDDGSDTPATADTSPPVLQDTAPADGSDEAPQVDVPPIGPPKLDRDEGVGRLNPAG